jgi:hypothetical protein
LKKAFRLNSLEIIGERESVCVCGSVREKGGERGERNRQRKNKVQNDCEIKKIVI